MENKEHFRGKISEAIEDVFDSIPEGAKYAELKSVFDEEVAMVTLRRTGKAKFSARRLGVGFHKFRRMLGKE